jgi:hypothetical protein
VPDAVEHTVSAQRLATLGRFDIVVDGRELPPRYAPGFPVLLLAPGYALLGPELGNAIVLVLLCGVAAVGAGASPARVRRGRSAGGAGRGDASAHRARGAAVAAPRAARASAGRARAGCVRP